jgi:hypothetical protein
MTTIKKALTTTLTTGNGEIDDNNQKGTSPNDLDNGEISALSASTDN